MKLNKLLFAACALSLGLGFTACDDDDLFTRDGQEAFIMGSNDQNCLKVTGKSGIIWKSRMEGNTIYIQVSPTVDPTEELDGVVAKFYVSKGATVDPDPAIPQNFAQEGGVQYTVTSEDKKKSVTYTVTHGLTDMLEDGQGFSLGLPQVTKTFPELGYPGELANYNLADSRQYGDLNGYVAYCGHNHVVLMAGQYSNPHFDNAAMNIPNTQLAFKVFNAADLSEAGNLNLGSINMTDVRAITSDWNGVLVALTNTNGKGGIYYWTSYSDAPRLVGQVNENLGAATDGSNYIQIAGDITGTANITTGAPRDAEGSHYMIHLENGQITDTQIVATGYSSNDGAGFQMISPIKPDANSSYLVGDTEGSGNNTLKVYANTFKGNTKVIMPNVLQSDWQTWWVGTGSQLSRTGARRPYVSSMYVNGKYYAILMLGTGWWWHNDIAELDDLHARVTGTSVAYSVNCAWSFGGSSDWYWDPEIKEAYWVGYTDRYGMFTTRLTCYE
ncbi:MAG: hypothetical protein HDR82_11450 [Bacteroides sp.]|nr:hypothetical protein [Bacteroides sp.]